MALESDAKMEEKLTCGLENNRNLVNFHQSTSKLGLKIGTFMGYFYPKQEMCELKIHRGVMCYDKEERCKIWKGIDWFKTDIQRI